MNRYIKFSFLLFVISCFQIGQAQEFNIDVKVSAPATLITDAKIFEALEKEIYELYNSNTWTDDSFQDHERIQGNIQLTIKEEVGPNAFKGELIIQTSRPIYNSEVSSPVMRYIDKNVQFTYDGLQPIQVTVDGYIDNFSSILSFYAYYMLGMDYDTFSSMGGDLYFEKAFGIFNALPSSLQRGDAGWSLNDKRQQNRYFLIENVRNPKFRRFREAMYTYHRQGLDIMASDFNTGRAKIMEAIIDVGRVNNEINNTILPQMFSDTKRIEIIDIFTVAESEQKDKVRSVMLSIDPSQTIAYRALRR